MGYLDNTGLSHLWSKFKALLSNKVDTTNVETIVTNDSKLPTGSAIVKYAMPVNRVATSTQIGGVKPVSKTTAMTGSVGVDKNGILWAETSSGDMTKAVYDTDNDGIVDNAEKLGGELPKYYALTEYHATFATASFASVSVTKADGTTTVTEYKCTVSVSGITATTLLTDLEYRPTGVPDTDEITKGIYGTIVSYESGAGTVSIYMSAAPSADIILYFKGRETA